METFKVMVPSAQLVPFVKYYWILETNGDFPVTERTIPTGCVNLIFHREPVVFFG